MSEDKLLSFRVLGREYPLRVRPKDEAFMRKVIALVSERIGSVRESLPREPDLTAAVVAAISLAEECTQLKEGHEPVESSLVKVLDDLVSKLDFATEKVASPDSD